MVSDERLGVHVIEVEFQSALRFAVVSDELRLAANHWDRAMFQSALRFAVVSDQDLDVLFAAYAFQSALRFAVVSDCRDWSHRGTMDVSIRFEVRGGFRRPSWGPADQSYGFQSALRFAVVSYTRLAALEVARTILFQSALRFAVVSDILELLTSLSPAMVSIRFEVRGGFRPYPLTRCPDKPCCGGFTHHPSSPPPTSGQNLS